ncbi:MAG: hypothetical protein HYV07_01980 [Deltaproteobacteria bacterium]|nr:hypothetical protein [Deltaproteobacteria bacterium]
MVVGALARNVYLRPRSTNDSDFLVRTVADVKKLAAQTVQDFEQPVDVDVVTKLIHRDTGATADIIVAEYLFEFEGMDRATRFRVRDRSVRVMPPDYLAAMKVDAAGDPRRLHDFGEVAALLLDGAADATHVEELIRRDLPRRLPTLQRILEAVDRARNAPIPSGRGKQ